MASDKMIAIEKEYSPSIYLIATAEFIKLLEQQHKATPNQISTLKEHIIALKDILDEKIPARFTSYEQLKLFGIEVNFEHQNCMLSVNGQNIFVSFFTLSGVWLEMGLNLNDVFSLEFAKHLTKYISPLTKNLVETWAGRGMLSAALEKAETKVLCTSDITKPEKPWEDIKVSKKNAVNVLERYKDQHMKVIYLCSWVTSPMFHSMVRTGIPFFLLMIGTSYLKIGDTLSDILEVYGDTIKSVDMNIQGYSGRTEDCKVRLLAVNMPAEDFQKMTSKIPLKYRK